MYEKNCMKKKKTLLKLKIKIKTIQNVKHKPTINAIPKYLGIEYPEMGCHAVEIKMND